MNTDAINQFLAMGQTAAPTAVEAVDKWARLFNRNHTINDYFVDSLRSTEGNQVLEKLLREVMSEPKTIPLTEAHYNRLVTAANTLIDNGAADETHALADVLTVIGDLIEAWETAHVKELGEP